MAASDSRSRSDTGTELNGFVSGDEEIQVKNSSTQTDSKVQGHGPRLSKGNLFTLLSLWMELFPRRDSQRPHTRSARDTGLVVVHDHRVLGLHCSGPQLHAGQVAVIKHGARLQGCDLYFSRKPCSTCLKMIINAGVNRISYWPADAEISLLSNGSSAQEAEFDATAAERLKSDSRPHICVLLQPLANSMLQFVEETSGNSDCLGRIKAENPMLNVQELFRKECWRNWDDFSAKFLIKDAQVHRQLLQSMGLASFCTDPYFGKLRQHMGELIRLLATVTAGVPVIENKYGFYQREPLTGKTLSQDVVRHCIVQAMLLSYRTEDAKVGVGTVIWAEGKLPQCDGTGNMYLVGCGYNAYPVGSEYAQFPQMDDKQEDRQHRKYRYIIHAEQNALTFRTFDIKEEENTMLFVNKCPCDECVPLIQGAGVKQIYTTDLDSGKGKDDISYIEFDRIRDIQKFIWQKTPEATSDSKQPGVPVTNGCLKSRREEELDCQCNKRLRT